MEVTKYADDIEIYENSSSRFIADHPGVDILIGSVAFVDHRNKTIELTGKVF